MSVRNRSAKYLYLTTALALVSTPTLAQETAPVPVSRGAIETVVVTAQKRAENVEKVPVAITAFDANLLEGFALERSVDLPKLIPGLRIENQIGYALLSIRGIGNFIVTPGAESSVAVYVDGVYQNNLQGGQTDFFDLESVEVLKGPQGTLYGRNATAGVINYKTRGPSFTPEGKFAVTYGNYNLKRLQAYVSGPLSDKFAMSISGSWEDRNSYQRNAFKGNARERDWTNYNGRVKALFEPNEDMRFTLAVDAMRKKDSSTAFGNVQDNAFGYAFGGTRPAGFFQVNHDRDSKMFMQRYGVALTSEFNLGWADLTSITAYRRTHFHPEVDGDNTPTNLFNFDQHSANDKVFTQELRLQSVASDSPLEWMIGGFYYHNVPNTWLELISGVIPAVNYVIDAEVKRESWSAFTHNTYAITPELKVTAAARFTTQTDKMVRQNQVLADGTSTPSPNVGKSKKWNSFTYRVGLDYDFGPAMAYVSVGTGFKSGMFNQTDLTNTNPVNPEDIINYEVGLKGSLFDRRVLFNTALFWQDYKDMQVQIVDQTAGGATKTQNAATARVKGWEFDVKGQVTDELTLFGAFTLLDPEFRNFPNYSAFLIRDPALPPGPNAGANLNVSGNLLPYASRFTYNFGFNFSPYLGDLGSLDIFANAYHSSKFYANADNPAGLVQKAYWDVNGSATFRPAANPNLGIQLWVQNLTDKQRMGYMNVGSFSTYYAPAAPRTFGLTLSYEFGR